MPYQSIAFIYKSLGCLHSLQPSPGDVDDDGYYYSSPSLPALKPRGFVTWQTIQILLGPEEHVPFIQNALKAFPIRDPDDGKAFPKLIPDECFPARPDPDMVGWHHGVSERLRLEAKHSETPLGNSDGRVRVSRSDSLESNHERAHAAQYFSDSLNRNREGRTPIARRFERAPEKVKQGGKAVASTMKQIASPYLWSGGSSTGRSSSPRRRKPLPDRSDEHLAYPEDHVRSSSRSRSHHTHPPSRHSHRDASNHRRERSFASPGVASSSDDDDLQSPVSPRQRVRRHRSHDPSSSPQGYFGSSPNAHSPHSQIHGHRPSTRRRRSDEFRAPSNTSPYAPIAEPGHLGPKNPFVPPNKAPGHAPRHSVPVSSPISPNTRHPTYPFRSADFPPGVQSPDNPASPPDDYVWSSRGPQPMWPPPQPSSGPAAPPPSSARGAPRPGMPLPTHSHRYVSPTPAAPNGTGVGGRRYPR